MTRRLAAQASSCGTPLRSGLVPAVCELCGAYAATRDGCAECGCANATAVLPLLLLTGVSGVGKSTIVGPLQEALPEVNVFDSDALLGLREYGDGVHWNAWLNVVHAGAQAGRATLLSGTVLPEWLDELPARDIVGPVHAAVLHCSDETRAARLAARPAWRESSSAESIARHAQFAATLLKRGWVIFDTTDERPAFVAASIAAYARSVLSGSAPRPHTRAGSDSV